MPVRSRAPAKNTVRRVKGHVGMEINHGVQRLEQVFHLDRGIE